MLERGRYVIRAREFPVALFALAVFLDALPVYSNAELLHRPNFYLALLRSVYKLESPAKFDFT